MLTALTTGLRFRFAILLAAFASLCFVAPPAVLAFGHGEQRSTAWRMPTWWLTASSRPLPA